MSILFIQVSWIRKRDGYMLYIGDIKFVDDERFELIQGRYHWIAINDQSQPSSNKSMVYTFIKIEV